MDHNASAPKASQVAANTIALASAIPKIPDFTAYLPSSETLDEQFRALSHQAPLRTAFDCEANISAPVNQAAPGDHRRIHGCKCFRGRYWSLTVRQDGKDGLIDIPEVAIPPDTRYTASNSSSDFFLNSFGEICGTLYPLIFSKKRTETTGMVVITGGTGCGKSNVVRGLIDLYLRDAANTHVWSQRHRVPHLVTYEDPIEKDLLIEPEFDLGKSWIDYTPRQRDIDVPNLGSAIKSALRQTPAAFYVGEVRDIKEWESLLEFAGTGHLIFTTAHAGSLVEAMGKIFVATRSKTAARRAIVADRLAALVHLRRDQAVLPNSSISNPPPAELADSIQPFVKNVVVPSLWRHSVVGAKTLMAEGQSSLLPQTGVGPEAQSCFGRTSFGDLLWAVAKERVTTELRSHYSMPVGKGSPRPAQIENVTSESPVERFKKSFRRQCVEWDLEGL